MKIWLMNRYYYPNVGGIENSLFYISKALTEQGHSVIILTQKLVDKEAERREYANLKYYTYNENKLIRLFFPLRLLNRYIVVKKYIGEIISEVGEPDYVISRDPVMGWAYKKVGKNNKIMYIPPSVFAYNKIQKENTNSLLHYIVMNTYQKEEQWFQEQCFRHIKYVIVFSRNVKAQIMKRMGKCGNNVKVFYPGCDEKFFDSSKQYAYNKDIIKILFVGRLVEDKNVMMVLKALKELKNQNIYFDIVGDGMQKKLLEDFVRQNNLEKVCFRGKSNTPEEYYAQCDFFVLPSKYEAFGQVIAESMASGTPVIGFRTILGKTLTAVEELIEDDVTGIIIKDFSVASMKEALSKAIEIKRDEVKYMQMRQRCSQEAKTKFRWGNFVHQCLVAMEEKQ